MDLVEAFLTYQALPADASDATVVKIERAAEVLLAEFCSMTRRMTSFGPDVSEEARDQLLLYWLKTGPRLYPDGAPKSGMPATGESVRALMWTSLQRRAISIWRRQGKEEGTEPEPTTPAAASSEAIGRAERRLRSLSDDLTPALRRAALELLDIREGLLNFDAAVGVEVQAEITTTGGTEEDARTRIRNRKYQNHGRAMAKLREATEQAADIDPWDKAVVSWVLDDLGLRSTSR